MRISCKYELIFVSTPKCGSHTGWAIMDKYFRPIDCSGMHQKRVPSDYINYEAFTFTRHPFDRAVSLWHSMLHGHPIPSKDRYRKVFLQRMEGKSDSFEDFCLHLITTRNNYNDFYSNFEENIFEHNQKTNLKNLNYFKLEELYKTLPKFIKEKTNKDIIIPHEHKREHKTWDKIKTPSAHKYLLKWAGKDFEIYNYDSSY